MAKGVVRRVEDAQWPIGAERRIGDAFAMAIQIPAAFIRTEIGRLASARPRPGRRNGIWLPFLGGGLILAALGAIIGDEAAIQPVLTTLGLATAATILAGVRAHHPSRPLPWRLVAVCVAMSTIGIGLIPADLGSLAEIVTGLGYLAGFGGFLLLIRGRIPGGERGAFLDAAILASGTAILIWVIGFAPFVADVRQNTMMTSVYFYFALIATGTVIRVWFIPGAHMPATRLLVLLVLASNGISIIEMLRGITGANILVGPHAFAEFAALAFVGAAALHPSMAVLPSRRPAAIRPIGRGRLVALTIALLVNPATLAIEFLVGGQLDPAPYLVGGVLIGVLVIARLGEVLRQLGDSLRERETLTERLQHQALYDDLTGLSNRTLLAERLATAFAARTSALAPAVLLVDLDDFKAVNDGFGHETGDALLVAVAQRIRSSIRDEDTAARLGGDEFVVALPGCRDVAAPRCVADRIMAALSEPFVLGDQRIDVHASIGVALAGPGERNAEDLLRNADVAMYVAKDLGKNRYDVYEPAMQAEAAILIQLRADLAAAIAGGDLRLHYQPVVDLRSGKTIGLEALVRWERDGALIPPSDFIPLAESSGLIGPLTDWVMDEACRAAAGWTGGGLVPPWVSINLSSSQLLRDGIVGRLHAALEAGGLPAHRLVVEITESSLVEIDAARSTIERLHESGIWIAIDDFGTGYSSLSYLARLPVDILKIDRSFVVALESRGRDEAIAGAIIDLARRLGLTTIGEGIETQGQLDRLGALGCELGQGYLFARPTANENLVIDAHLHPGRSGPSVRKAPLQGSGRPTTIGPTPHQVFDSLSA
jgi:diguanylate cyclase (GGDEF)-like protein